MAFASAPPKRLWPNAAAPILQLRRKPGPALRPLSHLPGLALKNRPRLGFVYRARRPRLRRELAPLVTRTAGSRITALWSLDSSSPRSMSTAPCRCSMPLAAQASPSEGPAASSDSNQTRCRFMVSTLTEIRKRPPDFGGPQPQFFSGFCGIRPQCSSPIQAPASALANIANFRPRTSREAW
jgi:hypothetical protein